MRKNGRQRRGFEGTEKKGKRKGKKYLWISFAQTVYRASYNSDARTNVLDTLFHAASPLFLSLLSLSCKFHACVSLDNIFIDVSHDTCTCPIIHFVGMLLIWCVIFISSC